MSTIFFHLSAFPPLLAVPASALSSDGKNDGEIYASTFPNRTIALQLESEDRNFPTSHLDVTDFTSSNNDYSGPLEHATHCPLLYKTWGLSR